VSTLADRIRGIVKSPPTAALPPSVDATASDPDLAGAGASGLLPLGGEWHESDAGACFVVDRRYEPGTRHGRETIADIGTRLVDAADAAPLFAAGADARAPFVFFDLETTGLSGGAGTHAFLVGCAWFDEGGAFVSRQFLMTRYADERPLLETVSAAMARAGALVTFNGKSFDAPVLETRYLFHRLGWFGGGIPHIDALHPARRFWGHPAAVQETSPCSLTALERRILAARRVGDVPGIEIPSRYFQFVRSGDARPLAAVLEHNRLDLLTLAALTARLLHLARKGPDAARDSREALALGTVYARAGLDAKARDSYARAVDMSPAPEGAFDPLRIESLRALALAWRRAREWDEAAACWTRLLDTRGCPAPVRREAAQALAIHHEHRVRDLITARDFALTTLEPGLPPRWNEAVQHRLARLDRKLVSRRGGLF